MFCRGNGVAKSLLLRVRARLATVGRFLLWARVLKLEWDKAASYPACQVLTAQDALYASLKRNERAQSTNGLLATQGRARARAVPKSKRLKWVSVLCGNQSFLHWGA
jgi:hypothetical protein